jgi:hypothetical protein
LNLDFDGGLGNTRRRVSALRKLMERQSGKDCVMFLTLNVRSKLDARNKEFSNLESIDSSAQWIALVGWHGDKSPGREAYRLKAIVPRIITTFASAQNLDVFTYPPIVYEGHAGAHLVHFAFELSPNPGLTGTSLQSHAQLLSLPLMSVRDGMIELASNQHPGFAVGQLGSILDFLGLDEKNRIVTAVSAVAPAIPRLSIATRVRRGRARP